MQYPNKAARLVLLVLLCAAVFAVVGGVAAQSSTPKVLVSGRQMGPDDVTTLDPSLMQDVNSVQIASEMFPGLTNLDEEKVTLGPGIATSWDTSADGSTFTLHLMDNVPWVKYNSATGQVEEVKDDSGNVRMVTAQDFAFAIQRTLDPITAGPYQGVFQNWIKGGAEFVASDPKASDAVRAPLIAALGIKVVDDHTLQLTAPLASSVTPLIFSMWGLWAEPKWVIDASADLWTDPANIESYGPYALMQWTHGGGGNLTLVKNPFWTGTPNSPVAKIDQIQFVFLDSDPQLANFEAGTLDVSEVPQDAIDRIHADKTLSADYFKGPGSCTYYYGYGTLKAPFDDASVRLAFSEAVDRQSIVENVTKGGQLPASYFSLPNLVAAPTEAAYPGQGVYTNIDDAKALWQAYLTKTGHQASDFSPTLVYNNSASHAAIAQAIQQMWQQTFGVTVQLTSEDFSTFLDNRTTFDVYRAGWCFDYPDANNFLHDDLASTTGQNWHNAAFDKLVQDGLTASTLQQRTDDYAQAEHILVKTDAAYIPIYDYITQDLTQPYVTRTHSLITREVYEKWDISK